MSVSAPPCGMCSYEARRPELVVHRSNAWLLAHTERWFPVGSLFLVWRRHGFLWDIPREDWADALPFMAGLPRMLVELSGAERTYLVSFSEINEHVHMVYVPKRADHSASHGNKAGAALLQAFHEKDAPQDAQAVATTVESYRRHVTEYCRPLG